MVNNFAVFYNNVLLPKLRKEKQVDKMDYLGYYGYKYTSRSMMKYYSKTLEDNVNYKIDFGKGIKPFKKTRSDNYEIYNRDRDELFNTVKSIDNKVSSNPRFARELNYLVKLNEDEYICVGDYNYYRYNAKTLIQNALPEFTKITTYNGTDVKTQSDIMTVKYSSVKSLPLRKYLTDDQENGNYIYCVFNAGTTQAILLKSGGLQEDTVVDIFDDNVKEKINTALGSENEITNWNSWTTFISYAGCIYDSYPKDCAVLVYLLRNYKTKKTYIVCIKFYDGEKKVIVKNLENNYNEDSGYVGGYDSSSIVEYSLNYEGRYQRGSSASLIFYARASKGSITRVSYLHTGNSNPEEAEKISISEEKISDDNLNKLGTIVGLMGGANHEAYTNSIDYARNYYVIGKNGVYSAESADFAKSIVENVEVGTVNVNSNTSNEGAISFDSINWLNPPDLSYYGLGMFAYYADVDYTSYTDENNEISHHYCLKNIYSELKMPKVYIIEEDGAEYGLAVNFLAKRFGESYHASPSRSAKKIIVAVCDRLSQYDYNNDYITPTIERL